MVPGWACSRIEDLNLLRAGDFEEMLKPSSLAVIFAEHVWEHLTIEEGVIAARNCAPYLSDGGRLRVAVPDGFSTIPGYVAYVKPFHAGAGDRNHRVLYNRQTLSGVLEEAGLRVELLEYFDKGGQFHTCHIDEECGRVRRSARFDPRNRDGVLRYTSLIVDAFRRS
jgi:predicted SAM-dependent methyltransferase